MRRLFVRLASPAIQGWRFIYGQLTTAARGFQTVQGFFEIEVDRLCG